MTQADSIFGAEPDRVKRLLEVGAEAHNVASEEDVPSLTSVGVLMEKPGTRIGRYRLLRVLGEGGMGIVYLAQQTEPVKREVALKVIKPGMDSKRVIARFEAEQQALALMEHPHVARVHDAGLTPSGRPYFVMEHVKGIPITEYCDKNKMNIEERLRLFLHVCEAIQYSHQKGIIHRDIKPSNILVNIEDGEAAPKVIDFGVARAISQPLTNRTFHTEQGQLIGTPEYMSPEQVDLCNKDIDTRTDVYSLGVLLYELLTGVLPFDRETFREKGIDHIRKVICEQDPATPSTRLGKTSIPESTESARKRRADVRTLIRKLHSDLDWITLKAMEKDRTRRYASVDAMATDIRNYLSHQPVSAATPGTLYRARKFARRHRQALAISAMSLLFLVGGVTITIMYTRVAKEHARAQSLEHERLLASAQMLIGNKNYNEALASIGPLLNSRHVGREAKLAHAQILLEQGDPIAAAAELETLLDKQDQIAGQAHFLLASIYYEGDPWAPGKTEQYRTKWEFHSQQAEKLIAGTAPYYFLQARATPVVKTKLELLAQALDADKTHYDSLRERAYIYYAQCDYDKMALDASRMIGLRPDNPQGHLLCAIALRELQRFDEAVRCHDRAIALAPQDATLYFERRETYMRMGRYNLAFGDAKRTAELHPEKLSYQCSLFAAQVALGQYEQAEQQYRQLISRSPEDTEYSPFASEVGSWNTKDWFDWMAAGLVPQEREQEHPWWPPPIHEPNPPSSQCASFWVMREAAGYYDRLARFGRRIAENGDSPSWSPDGTKIAYCQGVFEATSIVIFDLKTGTREVLTMPGEQPEWSPDGRYIAFVWRRDNVPTDMAGDVIRAIDRRVERGPLSSVEEVWVIKLATHKIRWIAQGGWPSWSGDSKRIYFPARPSGTFSWVSIDDDSSMPKVNQVLTECGFYPVVSPNEQYVADSNFRTLRILDIRSGREVCEWLAPPFPARGLLFRWSPDCRELAIGGYHGGMMGLWFFDTQTGEARRMLDGPATQARWSPDRSKIAVAVGGPYLDLWLFDLGPNRPTAEAFGDGRTVEEHCRELIEYYSRGVAADPNYPDSHLRRTDAALWIEDNRAPQFLEELEGAFRCTPYHVGSCAARAQAILSSPPEMRNKLLPLALLLARKAVEKEPGNPYQKVLDEVLQLKR
jgi:serine/threonine protein kinase/tetratricopeptide (TPR) repeat protein